MTITLQAVNELIQSLESAGELSIREKKFLKLAKEFRICSASLDAAIKTGNMLADQNSQLAAENVALNDRTLLAERALGHNKTLLATEKQRANEYCGELNYKNQLLDMLRGDIKIYQTRAEKIHVEAEEIRVQRDELAAENVAIREQSEEVYAAGYNHGHLNTVDGISYAGCVKDDFYSLALQVMAEVETPATDSIVAGIKADGVEEFAAKLRIPGDDQFFDALAKGVALAADDFAKQLREGAGK
ncbi:hypothetical protein [Klebsiella michiganensis]|uniref:hypothetical protein n=1 Tax=Klebsiella michiganensis TaxID=1134687 RepID=UPI003D9E492E